MARFLFWRLVQSVLVLLAIYTVTFFLLMLAPGDPFVGEKQPPEIVRSSLAQKYGLAYLQYSAEQRRAMTGAQKFAQIGRAYVFYLGRALTGDFGPSIEYQGWNVSDIVGSALPVSIALGSCALVVALWAGLAAGTLSAIHKRRLGDLSLSLVSLLGVSLPSFVVGSLLLTLFVVAIPLLPSGGWGGAGSMGLRQILLPAATLALFFLAYIARLSRASTLDVLTADFVRTARAKGLPERRVITRHVGANAALPILSYLGPAAANILVGSFVVERLFAIPGLGDRFVNACLNKDIPLVLGEVMVYSVLIVVFNLLVDIAYARVDPRISHVE